MPLSRIKVTLLLGRKLCPCSARLAAGATVEFPFSERPGAKTVRPRPKVVARIIRIAVRRTTPRTRQPGELPVGPPGFLIGPPDGCGGSGCGCGCQRGG